MQTPSLRPAPGMRMSRWLGALRSPWLQPQIRPPNSKHVSGPLEAGCVRRPFNSRIGVFRRVRTPVAQIKAWRRRSIRHLLHTSARKRRMLGEGNISDICRYPSGADMGLPFFSRKAAATPPAAAPAAAEPPANA